MSIRCWLIAYVCAWGGEIEITDGTISDCVVGLQLENVSGIVSDVEISDCDDAGIVVAGGQGEPAAVEFSNVFSHHNMYGFIFQSYTTNCTLTGGSSADDNTIAGVYCRSKMDIGPGLSISDNGQNGLQMRLLGLGTAGLVDGLQITGHSSGAGVSLDSLSSPEIENCEIRNNYSNVVARTLSKPILGDVSSGQGMNNWLDGAAKYDVANHVSGNTIKAENCYWGPLVGGVPQFSTLGQVDIIPWLTSPPTISWRLPHARSAVGNWASQGYPNPFNPMTNIEYFVAGSSQVVDLKIFDLLGRCVATLVNGEKSAGRHVAKWDGRDQQGLRASAGVYLYRIKIGQDYLLSGKLTMIK